jgi:Flp pilus assembly protein TadG
MGRSVILRREKLGSQQGVVSLLFALLLPLMLGFAAFAVDLPYFLTTRNQMQTTADAAALAGGRYLGESGQPNWDVAIAQAQAMLSSNPVAGQTLTQATVSAGYWDTSSSHRGLQALPMTPASTDIPAVQVSLSFQAGQNNGELKTIFANFLGIHSLAITVRAVAARSGAGTIGSNVLFPLAIPQCMYDNYWNASTSPPSPKIDPSTKSVYVFQIGTSTYSGCNINGTKFPAGAWAAATSADTSSSQLLSLITARISKSLSINDQIFVNSGNYGQSLYTAVNSCSAAVSPAMQTCRYVTVPIFNNTTTTGYNKITGFACMEILSATGGSTKTITASMSNKCATAPSSGIGPNYGVTTPPKLFL